MKYGEDVSRDEKSSRLLIGGTQNELGERRLKTSLRSESG